MNASNGSISYFRSSSQLQQHQVDKLQKPPPQFYDSTGSSSADCHNNNNDQLRNKENWNSDDIAQVTHQVHDLLGLKLSKMSVEERRDGQNDLHGVAEDTTQKNETPQMIQSNLFQMNQALDNYSLPSSSSSSSSSSSPFPFSFAAACMDTTTTQQPITGNDPNNPLAFQLALKQAPEYALHLQLACLRAENYNPKEAAKRCIRFFNRKVELFGLKKLTQERITMADLSQEDRAVLQTGLFQVLPQRDRRGRRILLMYGKIAETIQNTRSIMRALYYLTMVYHHEDNLQTQLCGWVCVCFAIGRSKHFVRGRPEEFLKNWMSHPARVVAAHNCVSPTDPQLVLLTLVSLIEARLASRFRIHVGTPMECIYNLMTFGIPKGAIPINLVDGTLDLTNHLVALQLIEHKEQQLLLQQEQDKEKRQDEVSTNNSTAPMGGAEEVDGTFANRFSPSLSREQHRQQSKPNSSPKVATTLAECATLPTIPKGDPTARKTSDCKCELVEFPNPLDVVLGRGRHPKDAPGPVKFHVLLEYYRHDYDMTKKLDKTSICEVILKLMKESGSRFLIAAPTKSTDEQQQSSSPPQGQSHKDCGGFVECDDFVACKKISHGFRNLRMKRK